MPDPPDPVALVARGVAVAVYDLRARVRLFVPEGEAAAHLPRTIGVLEADDGPDAPDGDSVIAVIGGDADFIARYLAGLECRFEVLDAPQVRAELVTIGRRLVDDHE
jgi:hypothetical protein